MYVSEKFPAFATLLALVATLGLAETTLAASGQCRSVVAVGETTVTGPSSFAGVAHTNLGDLAAGDLGDRQVFVQLLGMRPTGQGLQATTSHTFVGPDGVFTTTDNAQLVELSPGLFRLNTQARFTDGARGQLTIDGLVDFRTGFARWFAHGELCQD